MARSIVPSPPSVFEREGGEREGEGGREREGETLGVL